MMHHQTLSRADCWLSVFPASARNETPDCGPRCTTRKVTWPFRDARASRLAAVTEAKETYWE